VVFQYTFSGSQGWIPITSAITDHHGAYHIVWTPEATGNFTVEAAWSGNETHFGTSTNATVILTSSSPPFFGTLFGQVLVFGVSIAVLIGVIAFYITKNKRKRPRESQHAL
jgi:hypothetical protein